MKKKHIFYSFWVSVVKDYLRRNNQPVWNWRFRLLSLYSSIFGLAFASILLWLIYFNVLPNFWLNLHVLPSVALDISLSVFLMLSIPFFLLSKVLVFNKNRYRDLVEKYKEYSTRPILSIALAVLFVFLLTTYIISSFPSDAVRF